MGHLPSFLLLLLPTGVFLQFCEFVLRGGGGTLQLTEVEFVSEKLRRRRVCFSELQNFGLLFRETLPAATAKCREREREEAINNEKSLPADGTAVHKQHAIKKRKSWENTKVSLRTIVPRSLSPVSVFFSGR